ncbi:RNA-directed DNA polymerase from mobile element jockey, partial [Paramuricea clavata]
NDRLVSNGGGVCAYINSNIYCRRIEEFENSSIESLWLSVRPKKLPPSVSVILLAVVYHSTASRQTENVELYSHIQTNVDSFLYSHPEALVLITGDFNFRSTGLDANHLKRIAGLTQIVKVATRADVTLDWCLTNSKVDNIYESIQLPPIGTSDHYTILMKAQPSPSKPDNSHIWKRDLRDSRIRPFGRYITTFDWSPILDIHDCDTKYEKFNDTMTVMIEKFFPLERIKVRKCDKPWMTSSIKSAIGRRQKALHESGKNSDIYKYWRNRVQSCIKVARKIYYMRSVEKLKNSNPARWWKEVKAIGGLSSKNSWYSQLFSDDVRNCEELAENFNNFLTALTSHFDPLTLDEIQEGLEVPNHYLVDAQQIYMKLSKIKTTKSPGPDMFPNKILKTFAFELAPVISDIFNSSMTQGTFPKALKRSIVVPVPKVSPPKSIEDDLRPISLTSQIAKVMEDYFKKGFDLVDHNVIIKELTLLGTHPSIIRWIKAFLCDREQCVRVGTSMSSWKKTNGGLPQGTKLGPLLFAVLINSLLKNWPSRIKFVDDTSALEIIPRFSSSLMPLVVNEISDYALERGMELNYKKCKQMLINFLKYKGSDDENPIYVAGKPVETVSSFKLLLGVWISNDLSWNTHVDMVLKKANSRLYALRLLKKAGLQASDIVQIYISFIRSRIEYASPVWSSIPKSLSDILESVQKRALRIAYPDLLYDEALEISNLQYLSTRRDISCKKFVESLRRDVSPYNPLTQIMEIRPGVKTHDYDLRNDRTAEQPLWSETTERLKNFVTRKYY